MTTIRFTAADLDVFSAASHDRNPLHMSEEYARRTTYGSRVVFGVLNAIAASAQARVLDYPGRVLSSIECEFFDVALLEIDYELAVEETAPSTVVRVSDGRRPLMEVVLSFLPGKAAVPQTGDGTASLLPQANDLQSEDLALGHAVSGTYEACVSALGQFCERIGLQPYWTQSPELLALLWASYLVGMVLPGKRALFSRLRISFESSVPATIPFHYQAELRERNESGELTIAGKLVSGGQVWAHAELFSYIREDLPPATPASIEKLVGRSDSLTGKVALITGGSRGLGAALARAFALHGSTVILNYLRGQTDAEIVRDSLAPYSNNIQLERGDIGDPLWCVDLGARLSSSTKRLDFLFCNASPPLSPLWLEPSAASRIRDFITKSLAMVTSPMSALLPLVAEARGWNVLVSSTAVMQMHPHFPHYAVAKSAAEAVVRAASVEYRTISSLILRPGRMLTVLTNTPLGRKGSMPVELVAAAVLKRLRGVPSPGKVEALDQFDE